MHRPGNRKTLQAASDPKKPMAIVMLGVTSDKIKTIRFQTLVMTTRLRNSSSSDVWSIDSGSEIIDFISVCSKYIYHDISFAIIL